MKKRYVIYISIFTIILVLVSVYLSNLEEKSGFNLYVRNYTKHEYLLHLKFSDEKGSLLYDLFLPVVIQRTLTPTYTATFSYLNKLDAEFESFTLQVELINVPGGSIIARTIAFWPGDAGVPDGAGSNRIAVDVGIREVNGRVILDLSETL